MMYKNLLAVAAILFGVAAISATLPRADAHPGGVSVSYGANPLISAGGSVSSETETVFIAPADQVVVVTDLLLSMYDTDCTSLVEVRTSTGTTLAAARLHSFQEKVDTTYYPRAAMTNSQPSSIQHAFSSGLPLPAGTSLEISETGGCSVAYTLSGHYAHQ